MNEKNKFPMKIRFGEQIKTDFYDDENSIKIKMLDWPRGNFRKRCADMSKATWADKPKNLKSEESNEIFMNILKGKMLPNSLEHLKFTFLVEGMTLIEVTHLLRHRMFSSILAQCSGDRFLGQDSAYIPTSIKNSKFKERYEKVTNETKQLYQDMIDSKEISLLDARYILSRNNRYFYYFTANIKDLISFIHQRKCTQIQPILDNKMAHLIYNEISKIIPEIKEVVSLECNNRCFYVSTADDDNSRVYAPDKKHKDLLKKSKRKMKTLYSKTRKEMGCEFNPQDEC